MENMSNNKTLLNKNERKISLVRKVVGRDLTNTTTNNNSSSSSDEASATLLASRYFFKF
jgi:hypothetical protein